MIVQTQRLILRPFEPGDVAAYTAIKAKPEVLRFLPGGEAGAAHAAKAAQLQVSQFIGLWQEEPRYGPWAVVETASGGLIGHAGLRLLPKLGGVTEILYMLDSAVWGRGYATEAAGAARDYGFAALGLDRLAAFAFPENAASLRVMEKIGMRREPGLTEAIGLSFVKYTIERPI